jgi:hypothetical protein
MLVNRGRLALSLDEERWLALLASHPAVRFLVLDLAVAVAATRLPEPFHADPADRFLVAQARELRVPLLSADSKIRSYGHVRSLCWRSRWSARSRATIDTARGSTQGSWRPLASRIVAAPLESIVCWALRIVAVSPSQHRLLQALTARPDSTGLGHLRRKPPI